MYIWNNLKCLCMFSLPVSPGSAGKDSLTSSSPSDCSPILNTPKRPTHRALLATPSTRSRMYYSGLNSPAAIRWLCSPAICPDTSAGIRRRRTTKPARSEQVTHSTEGDKKEREVLVCVCVYVCACVWVGVGGWVSPTPTVIQMSMQFYGVH